MVAIITTDTRIFNADNFIEAFSEKSRDFIYMFIGKSTAWQPDDNLPDDIDYSVTSEKSIFDNMIAAKMIAPSQIRPMARRFNWISGTIYQPYDDTIDTLEYVQSAAGNEKPMYVLTKDARVYKCLDALPDTPSTVEPFRTDTTPVTYADGYVWKYMYTLTLGEVQNFLTANFMPCRTIKRIEDNLDQWQVQSTAGDEGACITRVVVENGGTGYVSPTVTITGDSFTTQATATAVVGVGGVITHIIVNDRGAGYTGNVTVTITEGVNFSASARAVVAPIAGHGADPRKELGAVYAMVQNTLTGAEGAGDFPISTQFRQIGMVVNPITNEDGVELTLTGVNFDVEVGDILIANNNTSGGSVVAWDYTTNKVTLKQESGLTLSFAGNQILSRNGSVFGTIQTTGGVVQKKVPATQLTYSKSELMPYSGKIIYIENRVPIQRSTNQTEEIKLIVEF